MITSVEKLALIRAALIQNSINAYIIPLSDPHLGEYVPAHWQIIEWLTGFTGSAATVVITDSFAGLWTDSRYLIQAEKQLSGSGFVLAKPMGLKQPGYSEWLASNLAPGSTCAFDGRIFSIAQFRKLKKSLEGSSVEFINDFDPVSAVWKNRPPLPSSVAFDHPIEYSGRDRSGKISDVREVMKSKGMDMHLLTSPDDIMWLLNIRGGDLPYTPVILSFALIGRDEVFLLAGKEKIPDSLADDFISSGIHLLPYENTEEIIRSLKAGLSILISPETTSVAIYSLLNKSFRVSEGLSIPARLKAIKNRTEIENLEKVMIREGLALTRFFYLLENQAESFPMSEVSLAFKINELRSLNEDFICPSFSTIAAYREHSAQPHYSPVSETDSVICERGILLIDSGGQYMGGTTDITRTITIGTPSVRQKIDFTLVLKGHIALARAKFPLGTRGYQLDILARKYLWENGLNYGHGTGHGVGFCLNVHEGPQSISPSDNKTFLEPGMLISNEPAIYREGEYGIRTENLILCYEDEETEFGKFLRFETVSLCYIDLSLVDKSMLEMNEIEWINSYHSEVYSKLSPFLSVDENNWLKGKTEKHEA